MRKILHPTVEAAVEGRLPDWSTVSSARYEHMMRVSSLLGNWAESLHLSEVETAHWRASGYLHDALREDDPETLRPKIPSRFGNWPPEMLHGPAVTEKLRSEGILDDELLSAIAYHSVGHKSLNRLGRALYCADFLEPGRMFRVEWCESMRARMPEELNNVTT
ncbi:MAG TPA: HD domain-containing protein, partial [Gemmatimonadetes bacterium]|nr:HD domain-containing protein [Gemmatimonadota bacterium]